MPCYDDRDNIRYVETEKEHDGKMAARLCAVFTVLEAKGTLMQTLKEASWPEAGVTAKGTLRWWEDHKRLDLERKRREREDRERYRDKQNALKKLTPAERKALGL
jgi:hypothetical protein